MLQPRRPSVEEGLDKLVHPHHGTLRSNKKESTTDTLNDLDGSQGHYAVWKMLIPKGCVLCDLIFITFLKLQYYRNREEVPSCQGLKRGSRHKGRKCS